MNQLVMDIMLDNEWMVMSISDNGYSYGSVYGFAESFNGEIYLIFGGPNNWAVTSSTIIRNDIGRQYLSPVGLPFFSTEQTIHNMVVSFNRRICGKTPLISTMKPSPIKYITLKNGALTLEYNEDGEWYEVDYSAEQYEDVLELMKNTYNWKMPIGDSSELKDIEFVGHTSDSVVAGVTTKVGVMQHKLLYIFRVRIDGALGFGVTSSRFVADVKDVIMSYNRNVDENRKIIVAVTKYGELDLNE